MTDELVTRLHQMKLARQLRSQASYRTTLRGAVRGLWNETTDILGFYETFQSAIRREFRNAWLEGMREAGLSAEDMTPDEEQALQSAIFSEFSYILPFGEDIEANNKASGGALEPHMTRVDLWVKRYTGIKNQALQLAQSDPVLQWVTHAEESCQSCIKLDGQRRRSSSWQRLGVRPQHPNLECMESAGGPDVCRCEFVVTTQPPTRGRLPKWRFEG